MRTALDFMYTNVFSWDETSRNMTRLQWQKSRQSLSKTFLYRKCWRKSIAFQKERTMDPMMMDDELMSDEDLDPPDRDSEGDGERTIGSGAAAAAKEQEEEEEEEEVYAYADPNDPVDRVLDVYLSDQLEDHLWVFAILLRG